MSEWQCPLCGKHNSIRYYDPTDFVNDILIIKKRSLGHGKGFDITDRYSLLDGSDPELLDLISDRVLIIYDMLYEDEEAEEESPVDLEDEDEDINDLDEEIIE